jgi:hypothetical protein
MARRVIDFHATRYGMPALFAYAPPLVWASGCALLALLYCFVWPRQKAEGLTFGLRYFVLRWFHALVWAILGVSLALHALPDGAAGNARAVAKLLAALALPTYAAFLLAAYGPRQSSRSEPP